MSTRIATDLPDEVTARVSVTREQASLLLLLERIIFCGLLAALVLTAIPYGTVEPWSEGLFECGVLLLTMLWIIHGLFAGQWLPRQMRLFYPLMALVTFALLQSIVLWQTNAGGEKVWYAISADAFETRRFVLKAGALTLAGILLARYTTSRKRLSAVVHMIVIVAGVSAIFGILRQSMQHDQGFVLPLLRPGAGYAQFSNRNHFAYLMEMAMGLVVGLMAVRTTRRERLPLYLAILLALWTALVLANSKGGLLAMGVQLIFSLILFTSVRARNSIETAGDEFVLQRFVRSPAVRLSVAAAIIAVVLGGAVWIGGEPLATSLEGASVELNAADQTVLHERARRRDIWRASWLMVKAHPLAGAGFGGYWAEIPQYHDASGVMTPQQAHNDYLEIIASGGIIGLALLLWFIASVVKQARKSLSAEDHFYNAICSGAIIGIVGVAVHSVVDFGLHITINALIFVMLLSILSLEIRSTRRSRWLAQ